MSTASGLLGRVAPSRAASARAPVSASRSVALTVALAAIVALPLVRPPLVGAAAPVDAVVGASIVAAVLGATAHLRLPYGLCMLAFATAGVLAAATSPHVGASAAAVTVAQDVLLVGFAAAIASAASDRTAMSLLLRAWCASALGWGIALWVGVVTGTSWLSGVRATDGVRVSLTFGDPNYAANYFLVSFLLVVAIGYPVGRGARLATGGILAGCVVLTGSNGALAMLGVALVVLAVRSANRRWGAMAGLVASLLVLVAGTWQVSACTADTTASLGGAADSCLARPASLASLGRASNRPLLTDSLGRAEQSSDQRRQLVAETMALREGRSAVLGIGPTATKAVLTERGSPFAKEAHNDYVAALVERGVLGALSLAGLVGSVAIRLRRAVRLRGGPPCGADPACFDGAAAAVLRRPEALVLAVVSVAIAGWTYEVLHFRHLWVLLGLVAAMAERPDA